MANRLAHETSPYLLQHKDNPVDWYPWGEGAFAKAKAEDKPVFLSVGYSSCHWCHVMEHESFEDASVAEVLNRDFVCVKVDREERPDIDEAYMTAVQLSSGRGGWPMTVFLTPDRKPFFAGTYFPKEDRGQHPGLITLCQKLVSLWRTKRRDVEGSANEFAQALRGAMTRTAPGTFTKLDEAFLANGVRGLLSDFDGVNAGFGTAPKFPPHSSLEFLLSYAMRPSAPEDLREMAIGVCVSTLEKMALGGIHDQVGGGFHRYSTDEKWLLPHFEKMLYDNALLLTNYARAASVAAQFDPAMSQLFMRTVGGIASWMDRELSSPEGLFYSALDADTEGEEGKFYIWTVAEIQEALGERSQAFIEAFGLTEDGNFNDEASGKPTGANVLHLKQDDGGEYGHDLDILLQTRESRTRPGLDDKALVSWNGLAISALVESGFIDRAERVATALLAGEAALGSLPHQLAKGKPSGAAFLDDYAALCYGLLQLGSYRSYLEANAEQVANSGIKLNPEHSSKKWITEAQRLCQEMIAKFYDEEKGGFFGSSSDHEELFGRSKPVFDSPVPSGNSLAIRCLLAFGETAKAQQSLESFIGWMEKAPSATEALYAAALSLVPEGEVAVAAPKAAAETVAAPPVKVSLARSELQVDGEGKATGVVVIEVPEGIHLNSSEPPARWLTPTKVAVQPIKAVVEYPAAANDAYTGRVEIPFTVSLASGQKAEEFEVRVSYQACTESECLAPAEKVLGGVVLR